MAFSIRFNEEKNQLLKATRGISFEEAIWHIQNGMLLDDKAHHNSSRPNQRLYVTKVADYVYVVPYVIDLQKSQIFLKTIYPSRRLTRLCIKKGAADV
jgi:uncharacterized DUF497 family protein